VISQPVCPEPCPAPQPVVISQPVCPAPCPAPISCPAPCPRPVVFTRYVTCAMPCLPSCPKESEPETPVMDTEKEEETPVLDIEITPVEPTPAPQPEVEPEPEPYIPPVRPRTIKS
jgi:hypothetical protein